CFKQAFWSAVLPGGLFQQRTVLTQLQWLARKQTSSLASQGSQPVPVHRLGRGTSGILLCAKSKPAKAHLAAYFADGTSLIGEDGLVENFISIASIVLSLPVKFI
ncbi:hypothetical protein RCOM_0257760, partial [Ricinus communis]